MTAACRLKLARLVREVVNGVQGEEFWRVLELVDWQITADMETIEMKLDLDLVVLQVIECWITSFMVKGK